MFLAYLCVMENLSVSSGVSTDLSFSETPRDTLNFDTKSSFANFHPFVP